MERALWLMPCSGTACYPAESDTPPTASWVWRGRMEMRPTWPLRRQRRGGASVYGNPQALIVCSLLKSHLHSLLRLSTSWLMPFTWTPRWTPAAWWRCSGPKADVLCWEMTWCSWTGDSPFLPTCTQLNMHEDQMHEDQRHESHISETTQSRRVPKETAASLTEASHLCHGIFFLPILFLNSANEL